MTTQKTFKKLNSYIIFKLVNEYFAINVGKVISILEMQSITEVPDAPPYMKGVINLRGDVLPIVDSHIKFNMPSIDVTMMTCILVLEITGSKNESIKLGLMVDQVTEVIGISTMDILPPPDIGEAYKSRYINGMYKKDDMLIMILDIDMLLSTNKIIELNESVKLSAQS